MKLQLVGRVLVIKRINSRVISGLWLMDTVKDIHGLVERDAANA